MPDINPAPAEIEEGCSAPSKGWLEDGRTSLQGSISWYSDIYADWMHFWVGGDIRWYMIGGKVIEIVNGKSIVRSEGRGGKKKKLDNPFNEDASKSGTVAIDMNTCNAVSATQARYLYKLY